MKHIVDINYYFEETGTTEKSKNGQESYISLPEEFFISTMASISGKDIVLIGLFCVQNFDGHIGFTLLYVLEKRNSNRTVSLNAILMSLTPVPSQHCFPLPAGLNVKSPMDSGLLSRMHSISGICFCTRSMRKDFTLCAKISLTNR